MAVALTKRRFTVDEYHRMVQAGILGEDDRVELLRGEIVEMTPIGRWHAGCVGRLTKLLVSRLGERAIVWVQNPVPLRPDSEPQTDVTLLRPCPDFYVETPLGPSDVFLVIEVADTSAATDRTVKIPLYAEAGVREAWLVDLPGSRLEVYRQPWTDGFGQVLTFVRGQSLAPEAFPDLTLAVDDVLG